MAGERPRAADPALNALLSKLRAVLGREAVAGRDEPRLLLPSDAFVDLEAAMARLHAAESAAAVRDWHSAWAPARAALHTAERGFLPGYDGAWIDEVRRDLEAVHLRALECVAEVGLGLGGAELAATERAARGLIRQAPLREAGYLHLMRVLAARRNVAEALVAYETLRVGLREELGIAPSEEAQALHARLLGANRGNRQQVRTAPCAILGESGKPPSASRGVVKRYGDITAVDGLDLDVPEGTCVGLLGPNGAGKSTTMRLLTAQAIADEGELEVLGYTLPGESKRARAEMRRRARSSTTSTRR